MINDLQKKTDLEKLLKDAKKEKIAEYLRTIYFVAQPIIGSAVIGALVSIASENKLISGSYWAGFSAGIAFSISYYIDGVKEGIDAIRESNRKINDYNFELKSIDSNYKLF